MADEAVRREAVLRDLIAAHGSSVRGYLARLERDAMLRDELWADVMELAHRHAVELESLDPSQARSWLLRTARYLTANASRRESSRRRLMELLTREPPPFVPSAEEHFFRRDDGVSDARSELIQRTLNHLSGDHRDVLIMDALGQKGPQIATRLGISHAAARARLARARTAFLRALDGTSTNGTSGSAEAQP